MEDHKSLPLEFFLSMATNSLNFGCKQSKHQGFEKMVSGKIFHGRPSNWPILQIEAKWTKLSSMKVSHWNFLLFVTTNYSNSGCEQPKHQEFEKKPNQYMVSGKIFHGKPSKWTIILMKHFLINLGQFWRGLTRFDAFRCVSMRFDQNWSCVINVDIVPKTLV